MLRLASTLLAVLCFATVGQAQSPAIRAGTYDLKVTFGGGVIDGTLVLTTVGDSLDAKLKVGEHDSPVRAGARRGSQLTLEPAGSMQIRYQLDFKGDEVTGTFTYDGEPGTLTGKRRRPAGS
jgi:hypothetical protein